MKEKQNPTKPQLMVRKEDKKWEKLHQNDFRTLIKQEQENQKIKKQESELIKRTRNRVEEGTYKENADTEVISFCFGSK